MKMGLPNQKLDTQTVLEGVVDAPPNALTDAVYCDNCGARLDPSNTPIYHGQNGMGNYCSMFCVSQQLDVVTPDKGKAGDVNVPG